MAETRSESRRPSWKQAFIILPWVIGASFLLYQSHVLRNVATRQKTASGIITAWEPENHSRYGYTFTIEGKSYSGWQVPTGDEKWTQGQRVVVYYDGADPSTSSLTDFESESLAGMGPALFMICGSAAIVLVIFLVRRASLRRPGSLRAG